MLNKLYDIVFGQGEFDKTKIDMRFNFISEILDKIYLEKIEDFEILESCIYKIKDQLRVKSSNLNRIIRDPGKKLTKKEVLLILDSLEKIKYDFLNLAFDKIKQVQGISQEVNQGNANKEKFNNILENNTNNSDNRDNRNNQKNYIFHNENNNNKNSNDDENIINENNKFDIVSNSYELSKLSDLDYLSKYFSSESFSFNLKAGKVPYIMLNFFKDINLSVVSKFASLFFETLKLNGTNIIIEDKNVYIIPRFINDNLFELPRIKSDIEKNYNMLLEYIQKKPSFYYQDKNEESVKNEVKKEEQNEDYQTLKSEKNTFKSKFNDETSLDSILSQIVNKKTEFHSNKIPDSDDKIQLEKEDGIIIEKNEVQSPSFNSEDKENQIIIDKVLPIEQSFNFVLYKDEVIIAVLEEKSKVVGEVSLYLVSGENFDFAKREELTYISLFSKVFSSVVFDVMQAHGTNILWNFSDKKITIVPRYKNDNLNLTWKPLKNSEEFNEQIKNKLLDKMLEHLPKEQENLEESNLEKKQSSQENNLADNNQKKINLDTNKEKLQEEKELSKEEKVKYLLNSIRKIP